MLQVLIVNNERYLINTESSLAETICQDIISRHSNEAIIDWAEPTLKDVL